MLIRCEASPVSSEGISKLTVLITLVGTAKTCKLSVSAGYDYLASLYGWTHLPESIEESAVRYLESLWQSQISGARWN